MDRSNCPVIHTNIHTHEQSHSHTERHIDGWFDGPNGLGRTSQTSHTHTHTQTHTHAHIHTRTHTHRMVFVVFLKGLSRHFQFVWLHSYTLSLFVLFPAQTHVQNTRALAQYSHKCSCLFRWFVLIYIHACMHVWRILCMPAYTPYT